jgi:hypothetical protein
VLAQQDSKLLTPVPGEDGALGHRRSPGSRGLLARLHILEQAVHV